MNSVVLLLRKDDLLKGPLATPLPCRCLGCFAVGFLSNGLLVEIDGPDFLLNGVQTLKISGIDLSYACSDVCD